MNIISSAPIQTEWMRITGLPPIRRDMLASVPGTAYQSVFYESALISRGWVDPSREGTRAVFNRLVENVTSGRVRVNEAIRNAGVEIGSLIGI